MTAWRVRGVRLPTGEPVDVGVDRGGRWTAESDPSSVELPGRFVLPGLVDAHCHLSVAAGADGLPVALSGEAARANLAAARDAGVTVIRDTGSPGSVALELVHDSDRGVLMACGRFLAPAGQYFSTLHVPVAAEDLVDAALAEVARGARWVKLVADFPVMGADGFPVMGADGTRAAAQPTYPLADVRRLAEAVHAAGARVAAHTTTRRASELIGAGIDSVEHGNELTESDLAALAATHGAWTPTLCAGVGLDPGGDHDRRRRHARLRERLQYLLPRAVNSGVTVLAGTDVVGSMPREVALLVEFGLSPQQALAAASTSARRFFGISDFQPGELADVVVYRDDPRDHPEVLASPAAVVARGRRLR